MCIDMKDLEIANMLADYSKELSSTEEIAEKGRVQLKHARLLSIAIGRVTCSTIGMNGELAVTTMSTEFAGKIITGMSKQMKTVEDFIKAFNS